MATLAELEQRVIAIENVLNNTVTWYEYFGQMAQADRLLHWEALGKQIGATVEKDPVTGTITMVVTGTDQTIVET